MIVPVSNGEEGPKSTTKPTFLDKLFHVKVVPTLMQKGAFALAPGTLGVTVAASDVRLMSTVQGVEGDPHVVSALHIPAGFASEQRYLLPFSSLAPMMLASKKSGNTNKAHQIATLR